MASAAVPHRVLPPVTVALADSLPVLEVFQLLSMVTLFCITTRVVPLSRLMPIHAEASRSFTNGPNGSDLRSPP